MEIIEFTLDQYECSKTNDIEAEGEKDWSKTNLSQFWSEFAQNGKWLFTRKPLELYAEDEHSLAKSITIIQVGTLWNN